MSLQSRSIPTADQLSLIDASSLVRQEDQSRDSPSSATAVSLFSSGGIGELGLDQAGFKVIVASELLEDRAALYRENFPETHMIVGDIWESKSAIVGETRMLLGGADLDLVYATPPCQGMSTNGRGKLASEVREGRRGPEDPRNRLVIPTLDIICELLPRFVLFENVPGMKNTLIANESDEPELIVDYIARRLGSDYSGAAAVVASEDFGVPQRRRRLLTIYSRDPDAKAYFADNGGSFIPHHLVEQGETLRDAIGNFPPLDASPGRNEGLDFHPQHRVPIMNPLKYWWVQHTPEGATAFNNQCVDPDCGFDETPGHREELRDGKWVAVADRPLHCEKCGTLLPRPTVTEKDGSLRPMKGFHSAYRRMRWDETARTITQNFIYEASDNKVHPSQNRVLSVYEAMVLQTISRYEYTFQVDGQDVGIPRIAEIIGESVPPLLIEQVARNLLHVGSETGVGAAAQWG